MTKDEAPAQVVDNVAGIDSGIARQSRRLIKASYPRLPDLHLIANGGVYQLLVADGNKLYRLDKETFQSFRSTLASTTDRAAVREVLDEFGLGGESLVGDSIPVDPPVRALSLAVAQKCNLGCTYCYAQQGDFGGVPKAMPLGTALKAVEVLFSDVVAGEKVNLSFLGGEPLLNRAIIRAATERAADLARARSATATFSITTNGTLVTAEDADFFEAHGFAVTVSLDGSKDQHDALRPYRSGKGSFDRIIARVMPLLKRQSRMQVSARVTVTPLNLGLAETLSEFITLGFHSVGFSPLLNASNGKHELESQNLALMLDQMVECGHAFEHHLLAGRRYPFANMVNALREIHRGTHRPYPCGAGAGYFGVSADGDLAACHRFVGDIDGSMGSLDDGIDRERQQKWLRERHVDHQEPCSSCWARYMCGGGCHHEVIARGRPACDYIRGWLHYCLEAHGRLSLQRPDWFGGAPMSLLPRIDSGLPRPE